MSGFPAFANDSKGMVLHDRGATYSSQKTLLHPTVETENGNFRWWLKLRQSISIYELGMAYNFNFHSDLSKGEPRDENTTENE